MPDCRKAAPLVLLWAVTPTACGGGGGNVASRDVSTAPPLSPAPSPSPPSPTAPSPPTGANGGEFRRNEFAASAEYFPQYRQEPAERTRALAWLRLQGEF